MTRVAWAEFANPANAHLLVAEIEQSFLGGMVASDPYDSKRLREGANLMSRVFAALKLGGSHAATPFRGRFGGPDMIFCGFGSIVDRDRVADIVEALMCAKTDGWSTRRAFSLTDEAHRRLVAIGGETDNRWAGRRRRKRQEDLEAEQSLRWQVR